MLKVLFILFYLVIVNWDLKTGECGAILRNVMDYGAVGDGITDDSQAFLKAWATVCGSVSAESVYVPNTTFLLFAVTFGGPCNSPNISVLLEGKIVAPDISSWYGSDVSKWIVFSNVQGLKIHGDGIFDGQGLGWWQTGHNAHLRPIGTTFQNCGNLKLQGFKHVNSASLHISITKSNGIVISNLGIFAPESSPNTNGISISQSSNVDIRYIDIATGDDCIAIGGGSSNINVTGVRCGPGHGISIGSLGANGRVDTVEQVHVRNCTFSGTSNGARIKTWQGGSGYAKDISFKLIRVNNVKNPIIIDQFYCPSNTCRNQTSAVTVSDVSVVGIYGTSRTKDAIILKCSQSIGCHNISLKNINITSGIEGQVTRATCFNAHGTYDSTTPAADCLLNQDSPSFPPSHPPIPTPAPVPSLYVV